MPRHLGRGAALATTTLLLLALAWPATVAAHAELVSTSPEAGATLSGSPEQVTATFSEALEASRSRIRVLDASEAVVAEGGRDPDDPAMLVAGITTPLAPGAYQVRWTASSDDGHLERGRFSFTVAAPTPTPTAQPTGTLAPTDGPTEGPALTPSPAPATASPAGSGAPGPSASPSSEGGGDDSESIGQIVVIGLVGLGIGLGLGWWRSRRTG